MKIISILWLFLLFCPICIWANAGGTGKSNQVEGQQLKLDVLSIDSLFLTIDLEDKDGIYFSPQPVVFSVLAEVAEEKAIVFRLVCIITTDTYIPVDSLVLIPEMVPPGKIRQKISFTPPASGFYRISVYAENESGRSLSKKINVGYDPEQIISPPDMKADFWDFWERTRAALDQVKPHFKMTLLKDKCSATKKMYHVEMFSFGDVKIEGYYSVPKKLGKYPAIIRFQGYAANPRFPDPDAMPGFCEFILSVRGQGIQKAMNPYGEWIIYGVSDKDIYYYRGAYMDLVRGVDFLCSRPEIDSLAIMAEGGSQGGAFALAVCALDHRIKAAAPRIPFLSDFRDYFNICPWPRSVFEHYLKEYPDQNWEKIYDILSYFDIKNLAGQITCPIIMAIGLQDEICPPHINFAGYNQINAEKKYYVYPFQKHSVDDSWWKVREVFFKEELKKLPHK